MLEVMNMNAKQKQMLINQAMTKVRPNSRGWKFGNQVFKPIISDREFDIYKLKDRIYVTLLKRYEILCGAENTLLVISKTSIKNTKDYDIIGNAQNQLRYLMEKRERELIKEINKKEGIE
jgi:hypothetical protein